MFKQANWYVGHVTNKSSSCDLFRCAAYVTHRSKQDSATCWNLALQNLFCTTYNNYTTSGNIRNPESFVRKMAWSSENKENCHTEINIMDLWWIYNYLEIPTLWTDIVKIDSIFCEISFNCILKTEILVKQGQNTS